VIYRTDEDGAITIESKTNSQQLKVIRK